MGVDDHEERGVDSRAEALGQQIRGFPLRGALAERAVRRQRHLQVEDGVGQCGQPEDDDGEHEGGCPVHEGHPGTTLGAFPGARRVRGVTVILCRAATRSETGDPTRERETSEQPEQGGEEGERDGDGDGDGERGGDTHPGEERDADHRQGDQGDDDGQPGEHDCGAGGADGHARRVFGGVPPVPVVSFGAVAGQDEQGVVHADGQPEHHRQDRCDVVQGREVGGDEDRRGSH